MKNLAILTVAGIAAAATAQGVTLHFDVDGNPLAGDNVSASSATWEVYASFTGYDDESAYFGGFVGSFIGTGDGAVDDGSAISFMAGEGTPPVANGANIDDINIFNAALLGSNDPSNPIKIFEFTTSGTTGSLTFDADGVASMFADDGIFALPEDFSTGEYNIISDTLVPAPGALALLGLGGIAAGRRRR